jgi:Na+-transporting methylmalonyl-CoA/oxaloacetate decarboxylase gamma subunit
MAMIKKMIDLLIVLGLATYLVIIIVFILILAVCNMNHKNNTTMQTTEKFDIEKYKNARVSDYHYIGFTVTTKYFHHHASFLIATDNVVNFQI